MRGSTHEGASLLLVKGESPVSLADGAAPTAGQVDFTLPEEQTNVEQGGRGKKALNRLLTPI